MRGVVIRYEGETWGNERWQEEPHRSYPASALDKGGTFGWVGDDFCVPLVPMRKVGVRGNGSVWVGAVPTAHAVRSSDEVRRFLVKKRIDDEERKSPRRISTPDEVGGW